MVIRPESLPTDAAVLTEMVLALDAENETLRATIQTLKELIFGARSEKLATIVAGQFALDLGDLETGVTRLEAANDDKEATKPSGAAAKPRKEGNAEHRCAAPASAALRAGSRAGDHRLPVLP